MQASGQLPKPSRFISGQSVSDTHWSGRCGGKKSLLHLLEVETRFLCCPARSLDTVRTTLYRLPRKEAYPVLHKISHYTQIWSILFQSTHPGLISLRLTLILSIYICLCSQGHLVQFRFSYQYVCHVMDELIPLDMIIPKTSTSCSQQKYWSMLVIKVVHLHQESVRVLYCF